MARPNDTLKEDTPMKHLAFRIVTLAAIVAFGAVGVGASAWAADAEKGA